MLVSFVERLAMASVSPSVVAPRRRRIADPFMSVDDLSTIITVFMRDQGQRVIPLCKYTPQSPFIKNDAFSRPWVRFTPAPHGIQRRPFEITVRCCCSCEISFDTASKKTNTNSPDKVICIGEVYVSGEAFRAWYKRCVTKGKPCTSRIHVQRFVFQPHAPYSPKPHVQQMRAPRAPRQPE